MSSHLSTSHNAVEETSSRDTHPPNNFTTTETPLGRVCPRLDLRPTARAILADKTIIIAEYCTELGIHRSTLYRRAKAGRDENPPTS